MQRIRRIADNHVVVETVYFDEEVGGKEVVAHTETYGQARIDKETEQANDEKTRIDSLVKNDAIAIQDAKLTELAEIQIVIDELGEEK